MDATPGSFETFPDGVDYKDLNLDYSTNSTISFSKKAEDAVAKFKERRKALFSQHQLNHN